jgi:hypothetical protein
VSLLDDVSRGTYPPSYSVSSDSPSLATGSQPVNFDCWFPVGLLVFGAIVMALMSSSRLLDKNPSPILLIHRNRGV